MYLVFILSVFLYFCIDFIGKSLQVMRGGRAVKISIFDVVVGDILPLKIGDQVGLI